MANIYQKIRRDVSAQDCCPIMQDDVILEDHTHPKKMIVINGSPYDTRFMHTWLQRKSTDPKTNLVLDNSDVMRCNFYNNSLQVFPQATVTTSKTRVDAQLQKIYNLLRKKVDKKAAKEIERMSDTGSFLYYFADVDDFKKYITPITREESETRLKECRTDMWVLRETSLVDVPGVHEHFVISIVGEGEIKHLAFRHTFGKGYWGVSGHRNARVEETTARFQEVTFISLLKRNGLKLTKLLV